MQKHLLQESCRTFEDLFHPHRKELAAKVWDEIILRRTEQNKSQCASNVRVKRLLAADGGFLTGVFLCPQQGDEDGEEALQRHCQGDAFQSHGSPGSPQLLCR